MEKLFAVFGMLANGGKDTIFKVAAGDAGGTRTTLFYGLKAAFIVVLSFGILLIQGKSPVHLATLPWAVPLGIAAMATYTFALKSLVGGDASSSVTVFRLNFVTSTAAAALFLGEVITARKFAGLSLALAAIIVFFLASRSDARAASTPESRAARRKSILYALCACICASGLNMTNKIALNHGISILHLIMYRYVVVCALCAAWQITARRSFVPSGRLALTSAACAVLMLLSLLSTLTALSLTDVSVVIPITSLSFLFTAVLSFIFLGEKLSVVKILGIALAAAGIIIIG